MLSRSRIRNTTKVLLAALLFAQAAIAAAACDMPDRAPAQAFVQQDPMPCHEVPAPNSNLCLAHCLSADQSADIPQVVVHAWTGIALFIVVGADLRHSRFDELRHKLPRPAAPPPRILFQTFLI